MHAGHKALFFDRLDVGVASVSGVETPRLVPFATTIYQNRNRAYNPQLGRFNQADPNATAMTLLEATSYHGRGAGAISLAFSTEERYGDGMNLYQYLGSNPWTRSDPLGLSYDPFSIVDDYLAEDAGSKAAFLSQLGQNAAAVAVVAASIASYLPFPFVGNLGDLALYALGEQSGGELAAGMALGLIPGGKLLRKMGIARLGSFLGRIGSAAWKTAKKYAAKYGRPIFDSLTVNVLGLAKLALEFMRRKPGVACGCFTASTLVWTSVGLVSIEQVQAGDWVLTRSEQSGDYSWQEVTQKIVTEQTAPVELTLWHESGVLETIQTTDEHPFWVEGKGWTRADALLIGHAIVTGPSTSAMNGASRSGSTLGESRAILLSASFLSSRTTVYNLSVATNPNFFVGKDGVWVHNCKFTIRNQHLAGKVHPVTGVPFDQYGYPDFSQWVNARVQLPNGHVVRTADFAEANRLVGLDKTPKDMTWHHHQDGTTMELVPRELHRLTGHTGSRPGP